MDTCSDVLMEDLIDYSEESNDLPHSSWTEQALDLFISILKNVKKENLSNHEMFDVIAIKMGERGYRFSFDQIDKKYKSLRKMYTDKKERNQTIEPELINLFGDSKVNSSSQKQKQTEQPLKKRVKIDLTDDSSQNLDVSIEDGEDKKAIWSPEATKNFLDLLEQFRPQLGVQLRTKKQMWEEITKRLTERGFVFTHPQVENKWKALLRHYRGRLELLRKGKYRGSFNKLKSNYSAWPELFDSSTQNHISFSNDNNLLNDDDCCSDDEPLQFEEAPIQTEVHNIPDGMDPVLIEDVKPVPQEIKVTAPPLTEPESELYLEQNVSQLGKIIQEIENFREENTKHQNQIMTMKKLELQAYKERTSQFSRIADGLGELMGYLKRKASDENL